MLTGDKRLEIAKFTDTNVNRPFKSKYRSEHQVWYSDEVKRQCDDAGNPLNGEIKVDLTLSRLKRVHTPWAATALQHVEDIDASKKGWRLCMNGDQALPSI